MFLCELATRKTDNFKFIFYGNYEINSIILAVFVDDFKVQFCNEKLGKLIVSFL